MIAVLFIAILTSLLLASASSDEAMAKIDTTILNECQQKVGASENDIEVFISNQIPDNHNGLCLVECFLDAREVMKSGKLCKIGLTKAMGELANGDKAILKNLENFADACVKDVGDGAEDNCETAKLVWGSLLKNRDILGMDFNMQYDKSLL